MIVVLDKRFRILESLTKSMNDCSDVMTYDVGDKILHEKDGKEYKYIIRDIIKTPKRNKSTIQIIVEKVDSLWLVK